MLDHFLPRLTPERIKVLCDTLRRVDRYLRETSQPYVLCGGSLLGFVRYGHLLPWDDDIDLAAYPLAIDPGRIWRDGLRVEVIDKSVQFRLENRKMLVEVFALGAGGTASVRGESHCFDINDSRRVMFMGVEISVPNFAERLLDVTYGVTWRTHATPPNWDHVERRPNRYAVPMRKTLEELESIVAEFRAANGWHVVIGADLAERIQ